MVDGAAGHPGLPASLEQRHVQGNVITQLHKTVGYSVLEGMWRQSHANSWLGPE